ncbi:retrotransposon protein, putative, ty1-copia subclass [Tanacetum coccineum]
MTIQGGRIQKSNKKSQNAKGKAKDDACHHCKEVGHWKRNCPVYLAELIKKKKRVGTAGSSDIFTTELFAFPNKSWVYDTGLSNKRAKHNLDSTYLWHCRLAPLISVYLSKKRIKKLQHDGLLKSTDDESFDQCVSCLSGNTTRKPFPYHTERATDLFGLIHNDVCGPLRHMSRQGASYFITFTDDYSRYGYSATRIITIVQTKKVDKTPYELWYGKVPNLSYLKVRGYEALVKRDTPDKLQKRFVKCIFIGYPKETIGYYFYFPPKNKIVVASYVEFLEKNIISQEVSGRAIELEEIQDEDTSPSKNTSKIPTEVEGFEPPQKEKATVRRSVRTYQAPERLCLNVVVEEHSLGDLNEPTNYKSAILDSELDKWLDAMNMKMKSMKDNQVWCLVDLPPNGTVGSRLRKIPTWMAMYTPIKLVLILIAIAAFYDYEIWQMDVKTVFLNGFLDEDIYMVQPEGFVDPKHHRKVCKLQSLKQASRSWNKRFAKKIKRGEAYANVPYTSAVGSIMYAVRCTRPDVAFAQNITSHFQQNPGEPHLAVVKTILKYLRNTKDIFLVYGGNPEAELQVDCYCDAGFETDKDDIKY